MTATIAQQATESGPTGDGRVQMAYLHGPSVSHSWHESMMKLMVVDLMTEQRIMDTNGPFMIRCDTGGLVESRNLSVARFLDETPHEWLFLIDTDMGFDPYTVENLIAAADPVARPVVGALCFGLREVRRDGMGGARVMPVPTLFMMARDANGNVGFGNRFEYPKDTVLQVAATGAACLLIHRSVVEKVRADYGDAWFDQVRYQDGRLLAEDLSFCYRVGTCGFPVFVHTGVATTHHKSVWIGADDYTPPPPGLLADWPQASPDLPGLPSMVDIPASLASLATNDHVNGDTLKLPADLDRYERIMADTRPEVIVETGTFGGGSARWFASHGVDVITVDVNAPAEATLYTADGPRVTFLTGSSTDPEVFAQVRDLVAGRRCMVSLDSDHSAAHVAHEIELYGPLVSPGCYMVVEDTLFGYAPQALRDVHFPDGLDGSPLEAVAALLHGVDGWSRDTAIERTAPVSHHPAGWWMRHG